MQTVELDNLQPLLPQLAEFIVHSQCTDMSDTLCIVPNDFLIPLLRKALKSKHCTLLPQISTLSELVFAKTPSYEIIPAHQCSLILAQLLKGHSHLYGKGSHWGLANNLLQLFDELSLQNISPNIGWEEFKQQLSSSNTANQHTWFSREAQLVYTLWQAWHQQMQDEQWQDHRTAYANSLKAPPPVSAKRLIFVIPNRLYKCEEDWLNRVSKQRDTYAITLPDHTPSKNAVSLVPCQSGEEQALAISIAARDAISQGHKPIIVGEDRRLTRRIHALLSRFQIAVDDKAGWTLSTTQIGACLEHWLQCIESNFAYQPLLDLLKSHLSLSDLDNKSELIFRLEQDLIHHENIASGLESYQHALESRQKRLSLFSTETAQQLYDLFGLLKEAATPLLHLQRGKKSAQTYLSALTQSMQTLQIEQSLQEDSAGQQLLRLLNELQTCGSINDEKLSWQDFRHWFNQALEGSYFRPSVQNAQALILNYQQAHFVDANYRIICSAESSHLPPRPPKSPFFNQQVRNNLGLDTNIEHQRRYQRTFQRLSGTPGHCMISWQTEQDGEPIEASRWVQQLQQTSSTTYASDLIQSARTALQESIGVSSYQPAATTVKQIHQNTFSAGSHQRLITCPYHYFSSDLLNLKPVDEIREALEKSDYGSRVHLCLEAFHRNIPNLPGPFSEKLAPNNQEKALELLFRISEAVFIHDTEDSFQHRSWLKRWQAILPYYIRWELERQQTWSTEKLETPIKFSLSKDTLIKGRIDRIDKHSDSNMLSIIDYKTGYTPSSNDMLQGEDVQLSTYAFTLEHVKQCVYINLQDAKPVNERSSLDEEDLTLIIPAALSRLTSLQQRMSQGEELPAWGEQAACNRCKNAGICRRQIWSE